MLDERDIPEQHALDAADAALDLPFNLTQLADAVNWSWEQLQPFREKRLEKLRQFVGMHYGGDGTDSPVPVPLLSIAVEIYLHYLVPDAPQYLVSTPHRQAKPIAKNLQIHLNRWVRSPDRRFEDELHAVVEDALFMVGAMKVALDEHGEVYAQHVDSDDLLIDMAPGRRGNVAYIGDRYRVPLREVKANPYFRPEARARLGASANSVVREDGHELARTLGTDGGSFEEIEDHVDLLDLWIPAHNYHLIVPAPPLGDLSAAGVLLAEPYQGRRLGPYLLLDYTRVLGNIMPLAPTDLWMDLHDLANRLFIKLGDQAERQKNVGLVRSTHIKDGERLRSARDGDLVPVDNPEAVAERSFGGANPATVSTFAATKELFSWGAGNLESLGGLSPSADTLGQERLLNAAASGRAAKMQKRTVAFAAEVGRAVADLLWNDPLAVYEVPRQTSRGTVSIISRLTPEQRQMPLEHFELRIDPYSMQYRTPPERLQTLLGIWNQVILPAAQAMAQQGIVPDWKGFVRKVAELAHLDELEEVLIFAQSPATGSAPEAGLATGQPRPAAQGGRPAPASTQDGVLNQLLLLGEAAGRRPRSGM